MSVEKILAFGRVLRQLAPLLQLLAFIVGLILLTAAAFCFGLWIGFAGAGISFLVLTYGLEKWQAS